MVVFPFIINISSFHGKCPHTNTHKKSSQELQKSLVDQGGWHKDSVSHGAACPFSHLESSWSHHLAKWILENTSTCRTPQYLYTSADRVPHHRWDIHPGHLQGGCLTVRLHYWWTKLRGDLPPLKLQQNNTCWFSNSVGTERDGAFGHTGSRHSQIYPKLLLQWTRPENKTNVLKVHHRLL